MMAIAEAEMFTLTSSRRLAALCVGIAALVACEENGSPAARVFAAAIRRWGRPAV